MLNNKDNLEPNMQNVESKVEFLDKAIIEILLHIT